MKNFQKSVSEVATGWESASPTQQWPRDLDSEKLIGKNNIHVVKITKLKIPIGQIQKKFFF